ncbi:type II toxin-antitoxin system PemK/MazF family toxin [Mucilaginibacter ginsenosidivorax]|uniref:Type II toxin-antitoxin system PemK/MazF family toxin n=1 Tax=Mucilaginibacter ginsenosidivorax TaxID=862126 RepID=A0A5B8W1H3_9SPHI|nr:type II toxin-antitoxin system PemK/MazF family toxin [Mucilaginibacter ginsenosidivorax]QEC77704.1 type II toxin-antitoxin system PemK/MazF family toxin [Mucilaginibacter ginsenosidivorax]
MAGFVKGDIVVIPIPFSDLSGSKKRPALVLANLPGDDIILCQITSQQSNDTYAIAIDAIDFASGSLPISSNIRPSRIFTADKKIIVRKAETLKESSIVKVSNVFMKLFS